MSISRDPSPSRLTLWGFPGGPVVKTLCSHSPCRAHWLWSLVRELRSSSCSMLGEKKKTIGFCSSRQDLYFGIKLGLNHGVPIHWLCDLWWVPSNLGVTLSEKWGQQFLIEELWDPHDTTEGADTHPAHASTSLPKPETMDREGAPWEFQCETFQCTCLQLAIFTIAYNLLSVTEILIGTCKESHGSEESA